MMGTISSNVSMSIAVAILCMICLHSKIARCRFAVEPLPLGLFPNDISMFLEKCKPLLPMMFARKVKRSVPTNVFAEQEMHGSSAKDGDHHFFIVRRLPTDIVQDGTSCGVTNVQVYIAFVNQEEDSIRRTTTAGQMDQVLSIGVADIKVLSVLQHESKRSNIIGSDGIDNFHVVSIHGDSLVETETIVCFFEMAFLGKQAAEEFVGADASQWVM